MEGAPRPALADPLLIQGTTFAIIEFFLLNPWGVSFRPVATNLSFHFYFVLRNPRTMEEVRFGVQVGRDEAPDFRNAFAAAAPVIAQTVNAYVVGGYVEREAPIPYPKRGASFPR